MKKCNKCGRQYPDDISFCPECGVPITDSDTQGRFCPKCGTKNEADSLFCSKCGEPFSKGTANNGYTSSSVSSRQNGSQNGESSGNGVLIAVVVCLAIVFIVVAVIILMVLNKKDEQNVPNSNPVESTVTANPSPDPEDEDVDLGEYKSYLDGVDASFEKLIISDSQKGQLTSYKDALKNAIDSKNKENCDYNKAKLDELMKDAQSKSKSKIDSLKKSIKKYEAKSRTKKVKKSTEYKKNKELAKNAMSSDDYRNAKTYYEACLDALKKAKEEKAASSGTKAKNDDTYKYGGYDDSTYDQVYNDYLNPTAVSSMSFETKRYYMNTLFAAYGYRFNNKTIQSFFESQSWYTPDYSVSPGDQSAIIRKFDDVCKYNYDLLK